MNRMTKRSTLASVAMGLTVWAAASRPPAAWGQVTHAIHDRLIMPLPGDVWIEGRVGEAMNRILDARILSDAARNSVLAEAEEAFRRRVDDRLVPGQGLWQGEFWGKWMLSAVAAQRHTGNAQLRATLASTVAAILATRRPDGYIGTYHDSAFVRSPDGKKNNWNVWCRKYTLWALIEAADLLSSPAALEGARGLMDHLMTEVGPSAVPIVETGKFAGLPSSSILGPVVELYRRTGDRRYLDYARYIVAQWGSRPGQPPNILAKGLEGRPVDEWFPDPASWTKAYEFISCVEGMVELYRATGDADLLLAAVQIHAALREHERTIFGGIGKNDKLLKAARRLETEAEVCDAVYWNRLSAQLLRLTAEPVYAYEFERTLYNVLLAARRADGAWGVRRLCLSGEHWPAPPHCQMQHQHCCVANAPRGFLQAADIAVMRGPASDGITVNLFLPGTATLRWDGGGDVRVAIATAYPEDGRVSLAIDAGGRRVPVRVRIPAWRRRAELRVGSDTRAATPDSYAEVARAWSPGDRIDLDLDLTRASSPGSRPPTPARRTGLSRCGWGRWFWRATSASARQRFTVRFAGRRRRRCRASARRRRRTCGRPGACRLAAPIR